MDMHLLKNGLIEKSFIPPLAIRELRSLVRYRSRLVRDRARCKNRILKELERGNMRLSSVLSDPFGKTGWNLIKSIADDTLDIEKVLSDLPTRLKTKQGILREALQGNIGTGMRYILKDLTMQMEFLNRRVEQLEKEIYDQGRNFRPHIEHLMSVPGIDEIGAHAIIAEIGVEMSCFPTDKHLSSWGCLCPGNNESAGKRYSTCIRKGNNYLKTLLVQLAWAASKTRTYFGARYRKMVVRKGKKRGTSSKSYGKPPILSSDFFMKSLLDQAVLP